MKKYLSIIFALTLVLLFSNTAIGSPDIDTWYSIEDEEPHISGSYVALPDLSGTLFVGEYYQNEFFFLDVGIAETSISSITSIQGSYIFADMGLFIRFDYRESGDASSYFISPGYCLIIDDRSYLALSLDYWDGEILGLALQAKHRSDTMKLAGRLYVPNDGGPSLYLDLAYQLHDALVIGGDLLYNDEASFFVGATWKPGSAVLDVRVNDDGDYTVSGVYYFGSFGIGVQFDGETWDLKAKYDAGDSYFILGYMPDDGFVPTEYLISCTLAF